jgi:glycosyltransferase involved in cell wall biosynthesis
MNQSDGFGYAAIVTTFNSEDTILSALESIVSQTISPSEIIIADDCSSDKTVQLILDSGILNEKIRLLTNDKNEGQSIRRNQAISTSNSPLLVIFDDDDISHIGRAKRHLEMFWEGADISFVSSEKKYPSGKIYKMPNAKFSASDLSPNEVLQKLLFGGGLRGKENLYIPACTSAFTMNLFDLTGGYDGEFRRLEDSDFFFRAVKLKFKAYWDSEILVSRMATISDDKGGVLEMDYENKLLEKHGDCLSPAQRRAIRKLVGSRKAYFSGQYLRAAIYVVTSPRLLFANKYRLRNALKRVTHDFGGRNTQA